MLEIRENKGFTLSRKEIEKIRFHFQPLEDSLAENVRQLKKWLEMQPHLPQTDDDRLLEQILMLNKLNLEKSKRKLDMYYSIRNKVPDFFNNRSVHNENMRNLLDAYMLLPLPRLTSNLRRIIFVKFVDSNPAKYDLILNAKLLFGLFDLKLHFDYSLGDIYVVDLANFRLGHMLKMNPLIVKRIYHTLERGFSDRIQSVHFINMPAVGYTLIALTKMILNEKLANRVHAHSSLEDLYEKVAPELLPCDYGGDEDDSLTLYEQWKSYVREMDDWVVEMGEKRSKEELRIEKAHETWFGFFHS